MKSTIPLVDLRAQYMPLKDELLAAIGDALDGMRLFLGENVVAFEQEFAQYCGATDAVGVGSGTEALHLALLACGVGSGDEVITVSHTFIATIEAICMTGATPVLVDIDPETYTMDVGQIEAKMTPRTRAIVPVHLYGQPADMDPILATAKKHGLVVIEDACQAHGAEYRGKRTGALADVGCFSFYFSKNLGAYGEAGICVTNSPDVARRLRMFRDHGSERKYDHQTMGFNARLDELQAAVLRVKLRKLDGWNEARRRHAERYNALLADSSAITPIEARYARHVYHLYVIRSSHRDELQTYLGERGVATGIHYPVPVHRQPGWRSVSCSSANLPVTEKCADEILSLPMYPELDASSTEYVAESINQFEPEHRSESVLHQLAD
jgi:dTDP-4-amino-4,6-dideoxygalactose transaminase